MGKIIETTYSCNLCGFKEKGEPQKMPIGWQNKHAESQPFDGEFNEKHICKDCIDEIVKRAAV